MESSVHSVLLPCSARHHLMPREAAGPGEAVSFPATVQLPPFPPGFPSAAFLYSSFPEQSPKFLLSSTPELLPLVKLLLHLVDLFLLLWVTLCDGLFVLF